MAPHATNPASVLALIVGIALVPLSIGLAVIDHRHAQSARYRNLEHAAATQAQSISEYFSRARSLDLITSRNPAFADFYKLPGSRRERILSRGKDIRETNAALAYLERLFPGMIGEACFIDHGGAENARAVKGKTARVSDLSSNERANSFFRPTFALDVGQVYQARPYVSPDTQEWVISNSTVMPSAGGRKLAIVHFEITVESLRRAAVRLGDRFDVSVVDRRTGRVLIDTGHPQRVGAPLGQPADRRFAALAGDRLKSGTLEVGGKPAAYERIERSGENANDWDVVASSRMTAPSLLEEFGASHFVMLAGSLLLLAFALTSLRSSQRELKDAALTDPLTSLANRRKLVLDLERELASARPDRPLELTLYDLDGFKNYNDTFGHPAGDALLARLGEHLKTAIKPHGYAYRMGGDEFCVLAPKSESSGAGLALRASEALRERGEGFSVRASHGSVFLPTEAADPAEAMRIADQRMYAAKNRGRISAGRQSTSVLLRVISERNAQLGEHLGEVADLCEKVGSSLGLDENEMTQLQQAAALHDIGKAAIPDEILNKPGPLDATELAFIRTHTLIGERILSSAPALSSAARFVRWSHEHYDGDGYPDGLAGDEIPLGGRIIAVCDAYDAMTTDRPYRSAMSHENAIEELRRCAGTQFDPLVVETFCGVVEERQLATSVRSAQRT